MQKKNGINPTQILDTLAHRNNRSNLYNPHTWYFVGF